MSGPAGPRVMLAFVPFHTPASPPLGIATLRGALSRSRPDATIALADFNLALFRRWLLDAPPHLCPHTPDRSLGGLCPNALVAGGQGERIWRALSTVPADEPAADVYMRAARRFDALYAAVVGQHEALLRPWIEGRVALAPEVIDAVFGDALADIAAFGPDLLGVSVLTERNLTWGLGLLRAARERLDLRTALGGAMTSHLQADELLAAFPWLDIVFVGEAENALAAYVDVLAGTRDLEQVPGIVHRRPDGLAHDAVCRHPPGPAPELDAQTRSDFTGLPVRDYLAPRPVLPIAMGRGCYWGKCTFCSHTRPYAEGVRDHDIRAFLFVDEAISPRQLRQMSAAIAELDADLLWGAEGIRVERRFDVALLRRARESGLRWLYAGVESSTQRLLDRMDKGIDADAIEPFIAACAEAGIVPQLSFIIGIPGTTGADLEREAAFMRRHPVDGSPFALLLGAPLQVRAAHFGVRVGDRHRLYATTDTVVHAPRFHFTASEGPAPQVADAMIEAMLDGRAPRMRPHLGEVHAISLADAGFFASRRRPDGPPPPAAIALAALNEETAAGPDDPWHVLDRAGCLEALGELQAAHDLVAGALSADPPASVRASLWLHMAAILNRAGHPEVVLQIIDGEELTTACGAAARAEALRAAAALRQPAVAIDHGRAMLAAGYEFEGAWELLAELLQATGQLEQASAACAEAERRNWPDARINDARARCLRAARLLEEAGLQTETAARKRAFFAVP